MRVTPPVCGHRASSFAGCTRSLWAELSQVDCLVTTSVNLAWLCTVSDIGNDHGQGCVKPPQPVPAGIQLGRDSPAQYKKGTMDCDRWLRVWCDGMVAQTSRRGKYYSQLRRRRCFGKDDRYLLDVTARFLPKKVYSALFVGWPSQSLRASSQDVVASRVPRVCMCVAGHRVINDCFSFNLPYADTV